MRGRMTALAGAAMLAASPATGQVTIVRDGPAPHIEVAGKPFLVLGGELANSSASSLAYLNSRWPTLERQHVNTVIAPIAWQQLEPSEGRFDYALLDGVIAQARAHHVHLVLLWFGAWKNSMSSYVPDWVKRDPARFPRVETGTSFHEEILSALSPATEAADAKAFAAMMAHLKLVDGRLNTVLMVQVENEIGMLPTPREYGATANAAFAAPVPAALTEYLTSHHETLVPALRKRWEDHGARTSGSWAELFGADAGGEEVFTAWTYAQYAEAIAAAGKRAYQLPLYVNVALNRPSKLPGEYPAGGPLPHLIDVWKAATPSIDLIAPDIYFANFGEIIQRYRRPDNPLFIPEANNAGRDQGPAEALLAIGSGAMGYDPFSIDQVSEEKGAPLAQAYQVLQSLAPAILARGDRAMVGLKAPVTFDGAVDEQPVTIEMGGYALSVSFIEPFVPRDKQDIATHGGLILELAPGEFLVAGTGITVTARPLGPGPQTAGIETAWEGEMIDGRWTPGRLLNGDETHQGRHIRLAAGPVTVQRVKYYRY